MKENLLVDLSRTFAVDVIKLYDSIRETKKYTVIINQLIRCGTSIGANIAEAQKAQTKPDFNSKMNVSLKEANETYYWLRLLYKTDYLSQNEFQSVENDIKEIIAILTSICKKTNYK